MPRSTAAAASGRMSPIVTSWSVRVARSATAAEPISPEPPSTRIRLTSPPRLPMRRRADRDGIERPAEAAVADVERGLDSRDQLADDLARDRTRAVAVGMAGRDEEPGHHLVDDRRLVRGEREIAGPRARDRDVSQGWEVLREAAGDLAEPGQCRVRVELARGVGRAAEQHLPRRPLDEQRQERGLLAGLTLVREQAGIP